MSTQSDWIKGAVAIASGAALTLASGLASGNVMTFSGIPNSQISLASYTEDGITATGTGSFWGYDNGQELHLDPSGFNNANYDFTFGGNAFNLDSVVVSCCGSGSAIGRWTAFDAGNNLVASLDMAAGSDGLFSGFGAGFDGVYRVHLLNLNAHFSIDDLTITAAAVPEPSSLALIALGLLGLGAVRRTRA